MSTLTHTGLFKSTSCDAATRQGSAIGVMLRDAWCRLQAWRVERRAVGELSRLSEHELRDIGITRTEIEAAARGDIRRGNVRF